MSYGNVGDRFRRFQTPRVDGVLLQRLAISIVLVVFFFTSFYTIDPEEIGVVVRLGKYVRSSNPGLHFKLPLGIEQVTKVPVQRQLKEEFGFRTVTPAVRSEFTTKGFDVESSMLTGDL